MEEFKFNIMENLKEKGLIHKYQIEKTNGKPINKAARYFVLRYDNKGNDAVHLAACREALAVYAERIKNHLPLLYSDLLVEISKYSE